MCQYIGKHVIGIRQIIGKPTLYIPRINVNHIYVCLEILVSTFKVFSKKYLLGYLREAIKKKH